MASNTTISKSINIEHLGKKVTSVSILLVNYHHSVEDNSNMSGPTTLETDEVGGNDEDVAAVVEVFGSDDSNGITRGLYSSKSVCINKVLCLSSLSLASIVEQYG